MKILNHLYIYKSQKNKDVQIVFIKLILKKIIILCENLTMDIQLIVLKLKYNQKTFLVQFW